MIFKYRYEHIVAGKCLVKVEVEAGMMGMIGDGVHLMSLNCDHILKLIQFSTTDPYMI